MFLPWFQIFHAQYQLHTLPSDPMKHSYILLRMPPFFP